MKAGPVSAHNTRPPGAIKRLPKSSDYRRVYRAGGVVTGPALKLYLLRQEQLYARLGIVVSRKVSHKATARNRIKRAIKQWFRQEAPAALRSNHDIVVVVKYAANAELLISSHLTSELQGLVHQCIK
jgi:ribonuclease P protein component